MIIIPRKNIYFKGPKWQRGSVSAFPHATAAAMGGLSVSPRADGDSNLVIDDAGGPATCYQGCHFDADGDEWEVVNFSGAQTNQTVWLDSGNASDVWVSFEYDSGSQTSWSSHTNGVRYNLGTNQRFTFSVTRNFVGTTGRTLTGYFQMWDVASGGTAIWTGNTVSWSATATVQEGGMMVIP